MKKTVSLFLAALLLLALAMPAFAESDVKLEALDTSALDYGAITYVGTEEYVVIYPIPDEALDQFDVRNAVITVDNGSIVSARPEKEEEYRYGSVIIKGKKTGSTKVTVTDHATGVSCSFKVIVLPKFIRTIQDLYISIQYLPYLIGMRILSIFSR